MPDRTPARDRTRAVATALPVMALVAFFSTELFDEWFDGASTAAWPLIRDDLGLSYAQVGLVLTLPNVAACLIEPLVGVLGDTRARRALMVGGGLAYALALVMIASAQSLPMLLAGFVLAYPASGAFVELAQATLMDRDPSQRARRMVQWTLVGALGVLIGPGTLAAGAALGATWRGVLVGLAVFGAASAALCWPFASGPEAERSGAESRGTMRLREEVVGGLERAWVDVRRRPVWLNLALLQVADLVLELYPRFWVLYLVDHADASQPQVQLALTVGIGANLVGTALTLPVLRRVQSRVVLRVSALLVAVVLPLVLVLPTLSAKVAAWSVVYALAAPWYPLLKGRLYDALGERSGSALTLGSVTLLVAAPLPVVLGYVADVAGLQAVLLVLTAVPVVLFGALGVPAASGADDA